MTMLLMGCVASDSSKDLMCLCLVCRLPAAVITSSGTAVANLLPAVIEASQSNIPMLLITADRPSEMRDTGANQTIDQVKIFGGYTRWAVDLPPPDHVVPVRALLTSADAAVRFATGVPAGPVHINCQFREPLAPAAAAWPQALLKVGALPFHPLTYPCQGIVSGDIVSSPSMTACL